MIQLGDSRQCIDLKTWLVTGPPYKAAVENLTCHFIHSSALFPALRSTFAERCRSVRSLLALKRSWNINRSRCVGNIFNGVEMQCSSVNYRGQPRVKVSSKPQTRMLLHSSGDKVNAKRLADDCIILANYNTQSDLLLYSCIRLTQRLIKSNSLCKMSRAKSEDVLPGNTFPLSQTQRESRSSISWKFEDL